MSTFVFSPQRIAELRKRDGRVSAVLTLPSSTVRADRLRHYYRECVVHDEDGQAVDTRREAVNDVRGGELRPARLTVLMVELADVYAQAATRPLVILDFKTAQACGFRTVEELRTDWREHHPRSELAKLIWFSLGDLRDHDRYLRRNISRGGDYAGCRADDVIDHLPALTEEQLEELATNNRQRDIRRRADQATSLSELSLAQRVARIESVGEMARREIRAELKIITDRVARGRKKLTP